MGRGLGAGAALGGGSKSLRGSEHKTVGPSRVKKREFAGPPVIRVPDNCKHLRSYEQRKTYKNPYDPYFSI